MLSSVSPLQPIPTYILSGFLGSGKTTLLIELLRFSRFHGRKVAVLMNEFGDINIDGELLTGEGFSVIELSDGCVCCQIGEDFIQAFTEVARRLPEMIFVEATGLADPVELLDQATMPHLLPLIHVTKLVTVADPKNFPRLSKVLEKIVRRQVQFADAVFISKTDEATPDQIAEIQQTIARLNPHAPVWAGIQGQVPDDADYRWLFTEEASETLTAKRAAMRASVDALSDEEYQTHRDFHTLSCRLVRPLEREKFETFLRHLPPEILRAKGFIRFVNDPQLWVVMFVNGDIYLRPAQLSPAPEEHLVFIGSMLDHARIAAELTACEAGRRSLSLAERLTPSEVTEA